MPSRRRTALSSASSAGSCSARSRCSALRCSSLVAAWTTTQQASSVLHLLDREGSARATLSVTPEGTPSLALTDHDEKSLAAMAITDEGPALGLYDGDRKPLIAMP